MTYSYYPQERLYALRQQVLKELARSDESEQVSATPRPVSIVLRSLLDEYYKYMMIWEGEGLLQKLLQALIKHEAEIQLILQEEIETIEDQSSSTETGKESAELQNISLEIAFLRLSATDQQDMRAFSCEMIQAHLDSILKYIITHQEDLLAVHLTRMKLRLIILSTTLKRKPRSDLTQSLQVIESTIEEITRMRDQKRAIENL